MGEEVSKVHIVKGDEATRYRIYGVFSSNEKAKILKSQLDEHQIRLWGVMSNGRNEFSIEEYEIDQKIAPL